MTPFYATLTALAVEFNIQDKTTPLIQIRDTDRKSLAWFLGKYGFNRGVEIGVEQGAYSETLLKLNPNLELYGVDPWKAYRTYREHVSQNKLDAFYEGTKVRLSKYNWTPIRKFSADAATDFEDGSLDFAYIDGNHNYINVVRDLAAWTPKVRSGGIISGHDFIVRTRGAYAEILHVVPVVENWVDAHQIRPWFLFGAKDVVPGERRESTRSFMWVKE
tara:strand:+ start:961 stop:1614 length:654 start_codon:yes stop_codon:yes gene_type:complete